MRKRRLTVEVLVKGVVARTAVVDVLGLEEVMVVGRAAMEGLLDELVGVVTGTTGVRDVVTGVGVEVLVEGIPTIGVVLSAEAEFGSGVVEELNIAVGLNLGFNCFRPRSPFAALRW